MKKIIPILLMVFISANTYAASSCRSITCGRPAIVHGNPNIRPDNSSNNAKAIIVVAAALTVIALLEYASPEDCNLNLQPSQNDPGNIVIMRF
jgi:hypothetical protein